MPLRSLIAFLVLSVAWGSSYLGTSVAVKELAPFSMVVWRLGLGTLVLLAAAAVSRPAWPRGWRPYAAIAGYAMMGIALPFWVASWSLQYADSSLAAVLIGTAPILTMLLAHFTLSDDRMTPGRALGVLLGFGGVALLMSRELAGGVDASALAALALMTVAISYAGASVYARQFTQGIPPMISALVAQASAVVVMALLALAIDGGYDVPSTGRVWLAVIWVGVLSSGIAFVCYYTLVHSIGPTRMQTVNFLVLVIAMSLGVLLNGEPLTWPRLGGSALIFAALFVANRKKPGQAPPVAPAATLPAQTVREP